MPADARIGAALAAAADQRQPPAGRRGLRGPGRRLAPAGPGRLRAASRAPHRRHPLAGDLHLDPPPLRRPLLPGEGRAGGGGHRQGGRAAPPPLRPRVRPRVRRPGQGAPAGQRSEPPARGRGGPARPGEAHPLAGDGEVGGRALPAGLGRALRPGGGRGQRLRDPGGGLPPGRAPRGRRRRRDRDPGRPGRRRRGGGGGGAGGSIEPRGMPAPRRGDPRPGGHPRRPRAGLPAGAQLREGEAGLRRRRPGCARPPWRRRGRRRSGAPGPRRPRSRRCGRCSP